MPQTKSPSLRLLVGAMALMLTACAAVGPDHAPAFTKAEGVPAAWRSAEATSEVASSTMPAAWWTAFADPALNELMAQTLENSPTLAAAQARLEAAQAARAQVLSSGYPSLTGGLAVQRSESGSASALQTQSVDSLTASWEIDLFGAVARGQEGASARESAANANLAFTRLSLTAEVVNAYLTYRVSESNLALNKEDLTSRQATARLTQASVDVGMTAPYLAVRAQASVTEALTQNAALRSLREQAENNLVRLTGMGLARLQLAMRLAPPEAFLSKSMDLWTMGLPADVLRQRPDVQAAERTLAAANADLGLAMADQLPRLTLSGGLTSTEVSASGSSLSYGGWSFGPTLTLPVFDAGRKAAGTRAAQARLDEARANFRIKTTTAVQEVDDGLSRYRTSLERLQNARTSSEQFSSYFNTMAVRHREGASSLLDLEDARRTWLAARQSYLAAQQEHLQAWTYLTRVTAGGPAVAVPAPIADVSVAAR